MDPSGRWEGVIVWSIKEWGIQGKACILFADLSSKGHIRQLASSPAFCPPWPALKQIHPRAAKWLSKGNSFLLCFCDVGRQREIVNMSLGNETQLKARYLRKLKSSKLFIYLLLPSLFPCLHAIKYCGNHTPARNTMNNSLKQKF